MNTSRGIFQNNVKLRQAVANAIDRRFMVAQHGYLAGKRTDQFLPYSDAGLQGVRPLLAEGAELREGAGRSRRATRVTARP